MLVIFDQKNRTSGVKEYLKSGNKNNHSVSNYLKKETGLSRYLNLGKDGDRDIKDHRIPLHGDLDLLDEVIKMGTAKGASESYRNVVLSFEEDNISEKHMQEIVDSFLETYMVGYNKDEYVAYAEAHKPKIKYKVDPKTGERTKRHLHIHLSIAKYSPKLDRLLDMGHHGEYVKTGGRLREVELWKMMTEKKYNLKSSIKPISNDTYKDTNTLQQVRNGLMTFCEEIVKDLNNLDELIIELRKFDFIDSIKKSKNAITPYISIKLNNGKSIRLKGPLFSEESFLEEKEKLVNEESCVYDESNEPLDIEVPEEFIRLQKARADKVNRDIAKRRSSHNDILSELVPTELNKKAWKNKTEKKGTKTKNSSQLSYRANNIRSKNKNRANLVKLNQKVDGRVLLELLKDYNINEEIYNPYVSKNGSFIIEVGTHRYTLIDFLLKEMNFTWEETVRTLSYTYKHQQALQSNNNFLYESRSNIYESMSFQQKRFIDIYKATSSVDLSGFYISKENDVTTLRKHDITIEDKGDTLQTIRGNKLQEKVTLMLDLAVAKGWNLEEIDIDGTEEFRQEVIRQVREKESQQFENDEEKSLTRRRRQR